MKELMKAPLERQLAEVVSVLLGVVSIVVMDGILSGTVSAVVPFWARIGPVLMTGPMMWIVVQAALRDTARARLVSAWSVTVTAFVVALAVGYAAAQPYQPYPAPVVSACWVWFGGSAVVYLAARRAAEQRRARDAIAARVLGCHEEQQRLQIDRPSTELHAELMGDSFATEATWFGQAEHYYELLGDTFAADLCQQRVTELRCEDPWDHLHPSPERILAGLPPLEQILTQDAPATGGFSPSPPPASQPAQTPTDGTAKQASAQLRGKTDGGRSDSRTGHDSGDHSR